MVQLTNMKFIILKLQLLPYIPYYYPKHTLTRRDSRPSYDLEPTQDWFHRAVDREMRKIAPHLSCYFYEWEINSQEESIFKIRELIYDKAVLVIGEESMYWIYYQTYPVPRRIEGYAPISESYCPCCFHTHYIRVMKKVIKLIHDHLANQ